MEPLVNFFLISITLIFQLVFMACFLFLYIKTKSKGVILIWITLLIGKTLHWLTFKLYLNVFSNNSGIGSLSAIELFSIANHIIGWLILLLSACGIIIIYNEWKQGKFQNTLPIHKPGIDLR